MTPYVTIQLLISAAVGVTCACSTRSTYRCDRYAFGVLVASLTFVVLNAHNIVTFIYR